MFGDPAATVRRWAVAAAMASMLVTERLPGRAGRVLRGAVGGLWLGLLGDARLHELDARYYARDVMYRSTEWNEHGLMEWEHERTTTVLRPGTRVIVPGCGGGREVLALRDAGYDAIGYEAHDELRAFGAALLAEHGHPNTIHPGRRDAFPDVTGDAVLLGWGLYSLVWPRATRIALLQAAAVAVPPGGPVVVSAFARADAGREMMLVVRVANLMRRVRGAAGLELGDVLAPNRVHVFTPAGLAAELREAGLELEQMRMVGTAGTGSAYACATARRAS